MANPLSKANSPAENRRRRWRKTAARSAFLVALATMAGTAPAQKITSSVYADDEFKVFISLSQNSAGVEFAQGAGWAINFRHQLYLYHGAKIYYLHVWVRDIGGGPTGLLGQFQLTNHRGCRFANGSNVLLTGSNPFWKVSVRQPASTPLSGGPIPSEPYFNNVLPRFTTATLVPTDLGANLPGNANGWPSAPVPKSFAGVSPAAHWIGASGPGNGPEMWFTTRIKCLTPSFGPNVNPN
jgi:hypothetical protein